VQIESLTERCKIFTNAACVSGDVCKCFRDWRISSLPEVSDMLCLF